MDNDDLKNTLGGVAREAVQAGLGQFPFVENRSNDAYGVHEKPPAAIPGAERWGLFPDRVVQEKNKMADERKPIVCAGERQPPGAVRRAMAFPSRIRYAARA